MSLKLILQKKDLKLIMEIERIPTAVIYAKRNGELEINYSVESAEKEIAAIEKSKTQELAAAFFKRLREYEKIKF